MTVRAIRAALLLSLLPAAGCGTVANLAQPSSEKGGRVPFGGVKRDVACLHRADEEPGPGAGHQPESEQYPGHALTLLCAADLPLSLVGDVLTWPYTASYTTVNAPVPVPPLVLLDAPTIRPPAAPVQAVPPATTPLPTLPPPTPLPPAAPPKVEKLP